MHFMRKYLGSLLLLCFLATGAFSAADVGNTSVISPVDSSNGSGTCPSWSGSAAPSTIDDAGRCIQGAIAREWQNRSFTVTSTGSANAYVVAYTVAPAALRSGQVYSFITNFAVTGSATVNINALGAKTIKKLVAGAKTNLASGDMPSGSFVMMAYDGTDLVWLNRGTDLSSVAALSTANTFTADQTIQSTDAGASTAPGATLYRNSASPAGDDSLGQITFMGKDDGGNDTVYANIGSNILDPADTTEDGQLVLRARVAGAVTSQLFLSDGVTTPTATSGAMGADTINASEYYKNGLRATRHLISTLTTTSGTTHSVTNIPAYRELYIEVAGVSFTAGVVMTLAVSDDNGSNYGTARAIAVTTAAAGGVLYGTIRVSNIQTTDSLAIAQSVTHLAAGVSTTVSTAALAEAGGAPAVINAIQFAGGTFDAGTIRVYGLL